MKQVLQDRSGLTVVAEVPGPACPSNGVLVATTYSAVSVGTERARNELAKKSLIGKARDRPDLVRQVKDKVLAEGLTATASAVRRQLSSLTPVGYSLAGRVIEVRGDVPGIAVGDLVACGGDHAAHASVVAVPRNLVAKVPEGVEPAHAALATIGAIALHGLRLGAPQLGESAVVIGAGLVGQLAARFAVAAGLRVTVVDPSPDRVAAALSHGAADGYSDPERAISGVHAATNGVGADHVLVCAAASSPAALATGAELARDRGALTLVGAVPITLDRAPLFEKELTFRVSRSYGPGRYDPAYEHVGDDYPIGFVRWTEQRNIAGVLDLIGRGLVNVDDLVGEIVDPDTAPALYERLADGNVTGLGAPMFRFADVEPAAAATTSAPRADQRAARQPTEISPRTSAPRVGLLGPGSFALRILVPALTAASATLETVSGGRGSSAESARRNAGFRRVSADADALIADPAVDLVVIATRHANHARLAAAALRAGKHVFCEKPLALGADELNDVLSAARDSSSLLLVGHNRRFAPLVGRLREHVAGTGEPMLLHYRVAAGMLPGDHWLNDPTVGGGRVLGECGHFVDTLRHVVGAPIVDVRAAGTNSHHGPLAASDRVAATLTFADGSIATLTYAGVGSSKLPKERLEVFTGAGRTAVLDDFRRLELLDRTNRTIVRNRAGDKGHGAELQAMVDAIAGRAQAPVSLDETAEVSRAVLDLATSLTERSSPTIRNCDTAVLTESGNAFPGALLPDA